MKSGSESERSATRGGLQLLRLVLRVAILAGLGLVAWMIERGELWAPVAVALAIALGLLGAGHVLARLARAVQQRIALGTSLAVIDAMDGAAFEDWVVRRLTRCGFSCENLPRSRDYGIDVVAVRGARRIGVQAKRYDGPVGNGAVQQAIAGAGHHGCTVAAVVTQSRFTAAARAQAASAALPVVLVDRTGLAELGRVLRRHASARAGAVRDARARAAGAR
ncbi:MAG TPA: restriction endonuclease [Planctomycetota bacterium]|nr:restriction endonuclease [Planctomycetota bacterium]